MFPRRENRLILVNFINPSLPNGSIDVYIQILGRILGHELSTRLQETFGSVFPCPRLSLVCQSAKYQQDWCYVVLVSLTF